MVAGDDGVGEGKRMIRHAVLAALAAAVSLGSGLAHAQSAPAPPGLSVMSAAFASTDLDRAMAFYTRGLGLTAAGRIEHGATTEIPLLFPGGGAGLLLIATRGGTRAPQDPPRIGRVILAVPDLKALAARLTAAGYSLRAPVAEQAGRHVLVGLVADPDGNELELVQRTP